MLTAEGSQMTASMFRDIKAGAPVEADHVIGDLIARGDAGKVPVPKLRTAYTHLKAYEKQRVLMVRSRLTIYRETKSLPSPCAGMQRISGSAPLQFYRCAR